VVDLERGDLETAAKRLDRMSAVAVLRVDEFTAGVLLVRARWSFESGDPTAALAALDEADAAAAELIETSLIDRLVCQARAAAALDDDEVIDRARGRLVQQFELGVGPGADAAVTWIDGFIAGRAGHHHAAIDQLAAAASAWEQLGRCTFAADACVDSASIAAAGGDHESVGRAVMRAEELARPRGLIRVLRQLDAVVAASGGSSQTPAPDPSPLDGLTPREREIAELVAVGKTNREIGELLFISEHTVRNQLVRVFDKLGISRRTELARLVN
jgi:DNA-binding CsgD family transcriptional regulator